MLRSCVLGHGMLIVLVLRQDGDHAARAAFKLLLHSGDLCMQACELSDADWALHRLPACNFLLERRGTLSELMPLIEVLARAEHRSQVAVILLLAVVADGRELVVGLIEVIRCSRVGQVALVQLLVVGEATHGQACLELIDEGVVDLGHAGHIGVFAEEVVDLVPVDVLFESEVDLGHGLSHGASEGLWRVVHTHDVLVLHRCNF